MTAYYNENDPFAAAWLRELISCGLIASGDVDTRSVKDVLPPDLKGYTQCHFFAGIGGWSYALRLARWPDDRPVWTGSCPCQPFSQAGSHAGFDDPRHLWPDWYWLIQQCTPPIIFGEQVASSAAHTWLHAVYVDLETENYRMGSANLCAAGYGFNHVRNRLYWVASHANAHGDRWKRIGPIAHGAYRQPEFARLVPPQLRTTLPSGRYGLRDDGVPGRVGSLRGYGNAIVPQVAAEFIGAWIDVSVS